MKKIKVVNVALLMKWKWRILTEKESICLDVFKVRYGDIRESLREGICDVQLKHFSTWWKNMLRINKVVAGVFFQAMSHSV